MTIGSIQSGISEAAAKVFTPIKNAAAWAGHQITKGFDKFSELIKTAWNTVFPFLKNLAIRTTDFLKTAPRMGLVLGASSLVLGASSLALGYAAHAAHTNHEKKWVSASLQAASIVTAIGTGIILGYGYAIGFHAPLI